METDHTSHRRLRCKLERRQRVCSPEISPYSCCVLHTERKRHTLTSKQNQPILHLEGMQKFRCMSEIWHHKLQQRSSLDVPPRFKPLKATNCGTGDLQNVTQPVFGCPVTRRSGGNKCLAEISLAGASHCTPKINITHT